jgi:hypothetical protein
MWGSVGTPRGYSGSIWIKQPCVTQVHAQLVVDSASHKKKKKSLLRRLLISFFNMFGFTLGYPCPLYWIEILDSLGIFVLSCGE